MLAGAVGFLPCVGRALVDFLRIVLQILADIATVLAQALSVGLSASAVPAPRVLTRTAKTAAVRGDFIKRISLDDWDRAVGSGSRYA